MQENKKEIIKQIIKEKKKLITTIMVLIILLLIAGIILAIAYSQNRSIREWVDKNIFRKEIMQDKATIIERKEGQDENICAFSKYIGVLNKNKFAIYGSTGNKEAELEVEVSNPTFNSANRFLAMAEKNGKTLYLITDKEIAWKAEVEGNISQVHVNKNGYVVVVITDTSYKTIVEVYAPDGDGKSKFKTFLSATRTADVSISNDNKHLAIAEVDTSGTIIQSNIKIISVDKASTDPTNSLEKTYQGEPDKLITNIKYQDKNKLVCMYTERHSHHRK